MRPPGALLESEQSLQMTTTDMDCGEPSQHVQSNFVQLVTSISTQKSEAPGA